MEKKCPMCGGNLSEHFGRLVCDNPKCNHMQYATRTKKKKTRRNNK